MRGETSVESVRSSILKIHPRTAQETLRDENHPRDVELVAGVVEVKHIFHFPRFPKSIVRTGSRRDLVCTSQCFRH